MLPLENRSLKAQSTIGVIALFMAQSYPDDTKVDVVTALTVGGSLPTASKPVNSVIAVMSSRQAAGAGKVATGVDWAGLGQGSGWGGFQQPQDLELLSRAQNTLLDLTE